MKRKSSPSWVDKLRPELEPKVVTQTSGRGVLVPTPMVLAEEIRTIPRGTTITLAELRERLARKFGADTTHPMTAGICLSVVAGASEEMISMGKEPVAPYWRVVGESGELRSRNPFGPAVQAERLRADGIKVEKVCASGNWRVLA